MLQAVVVSLFEIRQSQSVIDIYSFKQQSKTISIFDLI